ncbi:spore germination protein YaaH [Weissella uvarum]|uniref:LysM peptidoglycan-binding domain-containing protein n=1 Tax=Weissella uvarum TaxID=1479233 RepID=UPI0019607E9C|nr:LysM domain-containing protein [Weissella uvarum]MBM7617061.1 spore germination protein YaaH [Weissella uvarum]MCM0595359.1 LysM peptidoglycan-binding domain-containing protein [Weissella uvarum]
MNIKQAILMTTATAAGLLGATGIASADQVTIKSGDTLASIAQNYNTTADKLAEINNIENPDIIYAGETLETEGSAQATTTVAAAPAATQQVATQAASKQQATQTAQVAAPKQQATQTVATAPKQQAAQTTTAAAPAQQQAASTQQTTTNTAQATNAGGSTYAQFIANGGSAALWQAVVMPESGGNANAVSANGYRGLGQTKESWGTGSVAQQTQGMVNYANSRYGSVSNAVAFRQANGWW